MGTRFSENASRRSALVVIPKTVNFFNNVAGRRLAEALRNLGFHVDIHSLESAPARDYEWCFLISIIELIVSCKHPEDALQRIAHIKSRCEFTAMWLLEPAETRWFTSSFKAFRDVGLKILIDTALHDQYEHLPAEAKPVYHHVFYGLTHSEVQAARASLPADAGRVIPWAFVGFSTGQRTRLVQRLVEHVDPSGLAYLVTTLPITESGPHLNDHQMQRVLERTRYHVWCAHHEGFYLEGERFRRCLLAGALPIKVMLHPRDPNRHVPFSYLLLDERTFEGELLKVDFAATRQRFREEYCHLPTLEDGMERFLAKGPWRSAPQAAAA